MIKKMNIMLEKYAVMPVRGHAQDAGLDLRTPKAFTMPPRSSAVIKTGVHVEIPEGYYGKLESKSGLNVNHSIVCLGGIIDSGFTGEIVAKIYNLSDESYSFSQGDKIVQLLIEPCETPELVVVDSFKETERGNSGFGSTGK